MLQGHRHYSQSESIYSGLLLLQNHKVPVFCLKQKGNHTLRIDMFRWACQVLRCIFPTENAPPCVEQSSTRQCHFDFGSPSRVRKFMASNIVGYASSASEETPSGSETTASCPGTGNFTPSEHDSYLVAWKVGGDPCKVCKFHQTPWRLWSCLSTDTRSEYRKAYKSYDSLLSIWDIISIQLCNWYYLQLQFDHYTPQCSGLMQALDLSYGS